MPTQARLENNNTQEQEAIDFWDIDFDWLQRAPRSTRIGDFIVAGLFPAAGKAQRPVMTLPDAYIAYAFLISPPPFAAGDIG